MAQFSREKLTLVYRSEQSTGPAETVVTAENGKNDLTVNQRGGTQRGQSNVQDPMTYGKAKMVDERFAEEAVHHPPLS